jgi:hypothetical protein
MQGTCQPPRTKDESTLCQQDAVQDLYEKSADRNKGKVSTDEKEPPYVG